MNLKNENRTFSFEFLLLQTSNQIYLQKKKNQNLSLREKEDGKRGGESVGLVANEKALTMLPYDADRGGCLGLREVNRSPRD